jgi:hypothetical protein
MLEMEEFGHMRRSEDIMSRLAEQQVQAAMEFLKTAARPLDRALFAYEFEAGSAEAVIEELRTFQNPDGGFGNGLEPDFRCVASSALATTVGLQVLTRVQAGAEHEVVQRAIQYLLDTYDADRRSWVIVPREVETAPRAPWWTYNEARTDWGNPSAEILGYLLQYRSLVPAAMLDQLLNQATAYLNGLADYEFHELLCFLRLEKRLSESELAPMADKLDEIVQACVTVEAKKWGGYCLQPIQVASSPDSRYYARFAEVIPANLEFLAQQQRPDGSWEPAWSWGQFEDTWELAKQDWKGSLTLDNLRILKAYE